MVFDQLRAPNFDDGQFAEIVSAFGDFVEFEPLVSVVNFEKIDFGKNARVFEDGTENYLEIRHQPKNSINGKRDFVLSVNRPIDYS